jgi:hypothetical protein
LSGRSRDREKDFGRIDSGHKVLGRSLWKLDPGLLLNRRSRGTDDGSATLEYVINIPISASDSDSAVGFDLMSTFESNSTDALERLTRGEAVQLSESQITQMECLSEFLGNAARNCE